MTLHAIARAQEHYALTLTHADIAAMQDKIKRGFGVKVTVHPHGHTDWLVKHGATVMIAVIANNGALVTFRPMDAFKAGNHVRRFPVNTKKGLSGRRPGT